jgi:hypothetical protein
MTANVMLQAEPIDSLINKSVDRFGDFISKKQGNEYFFSFDITKDGNNPAYREYTSDAGGEIFKDNVNEYNAIISTVINFNTNYEPADFELYIFHGRYYTDSERVLVREVNAIFDNNTFANEENKLSILKNIYHINTDAKYLVKNLQKRVLDKIEAEKPNKRVLVIFAIEYKCIKYEKLEDAQLRPYNITDKEAHVQKSVFWATTGIIKEEEKKVYKYIQDIRTKPKTILDSTYDFTSGIEDLPSALKSLTNLVTEGLLFEKNRGKILSNFISNSDLIKLLNSFSEYQFSLLTWQERVAILSRFSKRAMTEEWLWGLAGNNTENIAIKVLATAPQEQYGDIIHYFEMTDADLLQNLVYRIDGDNFASLISYLSQYTYYQRSQPLLNESNVSQYIKNQRFLGFDDWKALPYEAGKYSRIDFAVRKSFHWNYQYELKDIDAFQYILVRFDDDFSTERGNYYPKGYIDFIPAITLYGLYNEAANRRIRLFVDGLGFATGVVGMVRQSGKALTISLIDMGIAVTDITLSLALVDELNKTEEGKEVLLYWNRFAMVYAGYTGVRMTGLVLIYNAPQN